MNVWKNADWTFWLISCGKLLLCYCSSLRHYRRVRMRCVRVRRCRCCWCRVALWTGCTGSYLPVILSAWHLHLYSSLFAPVVDLLGVTSSLRGTKLWYVTLCLRVSVLLQRMFENHMCSFSEDFLYAHFFFTVYKTLLLLLSLPVLRTLPAVQCLCCLYATYLEQSAAPREVQYVMVIWTTLGESCAPMNYCTWQHCAVSLSLFGHK